MAEVCKRCLLHELSGQAFQSVYDYIDSLDPSLRATGEEYRRRLELCKGCSSLLNGMCRVCGCFVEARAAKAGTRCPGIPSKW